MIYDTSYQPNILLYSEKSLAERSNNKHNDKTVPINNNQLKAYLCLLIQSLVGFGELLV